MHYKLILYLDGMKGNSFVNTLSSTMFFFPSGILFYWKRTPTLSLIHEERMMNLDSQSPSSGQFLVQISIHPCHELVQVRAPQPQIPSVLLSIYSPTL